MKAPIAIKMISLKYIAHQEMRPRPAVTAGAL